MAREHQHGIALGIERGEAIAERVLGVAVGGGLHVPVKHGLGLALVAGGRARVEQFGEKRGDWVRRHGF